ncbi:Gamma-aminobutyric acid receptor subunit beta [Durusdinium trenchii]|uniref:Gamma-aminobutyric acid receptor subunit beta n=1 Tax=Durusdinium trenchii TaxID=1381693 RepID=A0ABP0Q9T6_9DINO
MGADPWCLPLSDKDKPCSCREVVGLAPQLQPLMGYRYLELRPPGYENSSVLREYYQYSTTQKRRLVDCRHAIKVFVEINPHEIKSIDDEKEEFKVLMVLKFWWIDPFLKNLECTVYMEERGEIVKITGLISKLSETGDLELLCDNGDAAHTRSIKRSEYIRKTIQEIDWSKHFFPVHTFANIQGECTDHCQPVYEVVWMDERGTFAPFTERASRGAMHGAGAMSDAGSDGRSDKNMRNQLLIAKRFDDFFLENKCFFQSQTLATSRLTQSAAFFETRMVSSLEAVWTIRRVLPVRCVVG